MAKIDSTMPIGCMAELMPIHCDGTPWLSMISDSSGNISPKVKPNTVMAATAASRLTMRCLSIGLAPHQLAASDGEAGQ